MDRLTFEKLKAERDRARKEREEAERREAELAQRMEEALSGETFSDHKWRLDEDLVSIHLAGGGQVTLTTDNLRDILSSLEIYNEASLREVLRPFERHLQDSSEQMDQLQKFLLRSLEIAGTLKEGRIYLRLRKGPNNKQMGSYKKTMEVADPVQTRQQVQKAMSEIDEPLVKLELVHRKSRRHKLKVKKHLTLRSPRTGESSI